MAERDYVGHEAQLYGVEEHRLVGGKGDGMRLFQVRNGKGLEFTVSADRGADISRLSFRGVNMSYFSPCGYVAPAYYDEPGTGFLKSFTAGFLTTCGLCSVGAPCEDEGEVLPLHGTLNNTPAEQIYWEQDTEEIRIHARINDAGIFSRKLVLERVIHCSKKENQITIKDTIKNEGDVAYPVEILYHMNMGYPLLSESSEVFIPSTKVVPRDEHAAEDLDTWNQMLPPTTEFVEQCYFHQFDQTGLAAIYNKAIGQGLEIRFDVEQLQYFTEWKMMGKRDYVLGLEPGNCHPDGRDKMRAEGNLKILEPDERVEYTVNIRMIENETEWEKEKRSC